MLAWENIEASSTVDDAGEARGARWDRQRANDRSEAGSELDNGRERRDEKLGMGRKQAKCGTFWVGMEWPSRSGCARDGVQ